MGHSDYSRNPADFRDLLTGLCSKYRCKEKEVIAYLYSVYIGNKLWHRWYNFQKNGFEDISDNTLDPKLSQLTDDYDRAERVKESTQRRAIIDTWKINLPEQRIKYPDLKNFKWAFKKKIRPERVSGWAKRKGLNVHSLWNNLLGHRRQIDIIRLMAKEMKISHWSELYDFLERHKRDAVESE